MGSLKSRVESDLVVMVEINIVITPYSTPVLLFVGGRKVAVTEELLEFRAGLVITLRAV